MMVMNDRVIQIRVVELEYECVFHLIYNDVNESLAEFLVNVSKKIKDLFNFLFYLHGISAYDIYILFLS